MDKLQYSMDKRGIGIITMDDGKANAMNGDFFSEMQHTLDQAEKDQSKAVVIKGRPGYFSGGLDLKHVMTLSQNDLHDFVFTFAKTMLRIYAFPIPTIAVATGHAIAGGAMLSFACDLRFIADGSYKIQMNETLIGVNLPTWMFLIADSAVPSNLQSEALLHSYAYSPKEAVEKRIFNGFLSNSDDVLMEINPTIEALLNINLASYAESKKRSRTPEKINDAITLLKDELV